MVEEELRERLATPGVDGGGGHEYHVRLFFAHPEIDSR